MKQILAIFLILITLTSQKSFKSAQKQFKEKRGSDKFEFSGFSKMMSGDLDTKESQEQFVKSEALELEREVDTAAMMAESMVAGVQKSLSAMGMSQQKSDFFNDIIDVIENVREAEDEYFEELHEQELQQQHLQPQENVVMEEMIIEYIDGEYYITEIDIVQDWNDQDAQFFIMSDPFGDDEDDEEDILIGEEMLKQIEQDMLEYEELIEELVQVAQEEEQNQKVINIIEPNSEEEEEEMAIIEDILDMISYDDDNIEKEDLSYLDQIPGKKDIGIQDIKKMKEIEEQKYQMTLGSIEELIQENQSAVNHDRFVGFVVLVSVMVMVFLCFFQNYKEKSEKAAEEYNTYSQYSQLDSEQQQQQNEDQSLLNEDYEINTSKLKNNQSEEELDTLNNSKNE